MDVVCHHEVRCFWKQRLQPDGRSALDPNYLVIVCTRSSKLVQMKGKHDLAIMVGRLMGPFHIP